MDVPPGATYVVLTSYYGHEVGGVPYSSEVEALVTGPGVVTPASEGHPIGHVWRVGFGDWEECGETPSSIFFDGFESGDLSAWQ